MTHSWLARRLGICLALALLALLVPSMAQAQQTSFGSNSRSRSPARQRFLNVCRRT